MKRFFFPLDRVRRWRSEQAAIEEMKLGEIRGRLAAFGAEKLQVAHDRARSEQELLGQDFIGSDQLQSLAQFQQHTRMKIHAVEILERLAETEIEQQLQKVIRARQQAELLERLKQKALAEWNSANDREQESVATELFLAKRARPPSRRGF